MLDRVKYLAGIVFLASISLFLRFSLFGFDSYAWNELVCNGWSKTLKGNPFAWQLIQYLPCSLLFLKVVMFLCLFFTVLIIWKIVKDFYDERSAWISIILLLSLSPIMLFEFGKFENEIFAYPFIVLGIYFLLNKKFIFGFVSLFFSLVFWAFPYYFTFFGGSVLEQQIFSGLLPLFGLIFVVPLIFLSKDKNILVGSVVTLVMFLFNAKFFIFFIPFVALGLGELVKILDEREQLKNFVYVLAFILLIGWNVAFFFASPTIHEHIVVEEAVQLHKDTNFLIFNDWSYGYWLLNHGYDSGIYGGGKKTDYNLIEKPFIGLTMEDLSAVGCVPTSPGFSSLTRSMKVWKCV